jgi:hypothetical protein
MHYGITGVCIRNAPDCGQIGKPCCIISPASYPSILKWMCELPGGERGQCRNAAVLEADGAGVKLRDLLCGT